MKSKFNKSLGELSDKKATNIDEIPAELLENLREEKIYQYINCSKSLKIAMTMEVYYRILS